MYQLVNSYLHWLILINNLVNKYSKSTQSAHKVADPFFISSGITSESKKSGKESELGSSDFEPRATNLQPSNPIRSILTHEKHWQNTP